MRATRVQQEGVCTTVKQQVLVVCSDNTICRVIEEVAGGWMIKTIACSSVQESRALLSKSGPAVIFCEKRLQEGTYRDLLSIVPKAPVVIMISDVTNDGVRREAIELGALDVIASPCSRKDVQWMIIRAMQDRSTTTK